MKTRLITPSLVVALAAVATMHGSATADTAYGRQCNRVLATRTVAAFPGIDLRQFHRHSCNSTLAVAEDGRGAGLDYDPAIGPRVLANTGAMVTGCIALDFPLNPGWLLAAIDVVAKPSPNACGPSPCGSGYCGTGGNFVVFGYYPYGVRQIRSVTVATPNYAEYKVMLREPAQRVLICRAADGPARDDILIDSVKGCAVRP